MAAHQTREWPTVQQFPAATQAKLVETINKLKEENASTLTILVMGKGGVGKSSTVNSILGDRSAPVSAFQSEGLRPMMFSRTHSGFTLNIIDTPGLIEGGYLNDHALDIIKKFLLNKTIDILLYVDRLDSYRVDTLDSQVIKGITESLGKEIWRRGVVVLTHAQLTPPDALDYADFSTRRSESLMEVLRRGSRIKRKEFIAAPIPVVLVENSGRCATNENGEKVLPNGTAWISNLMQVIAEVISNGSNPVIVDRKLIDGPNPNDRFKYLIPLIAAFQFFFVRKQIIAAIKKDIASESKPLWELRDMGLADRKF